MNHTTTLTITFTLLTVLLTVPASATHQLPEPVLHWKLDETTGQGSEIVTNGGFETYTVTPGAPDSWTNPGTDVIAKETTIKRTGSNSVKLTADGDGLAQLRQTLTAVIGKSYLVEGWCRTSGQAIEACAIRVVDNTGPLELTRRQGTDSATTFEKLSFTFEAASTSYFVEMQNADGGAITAGAVTYWDDVSLKEIVAEDTAGDNDAVLTGATNGVGPTIGAAGFDGTAYDFSGTQWATDDTTPDLSAGDGAEWTITAWVYLPAGVTGQRIAISYGELLGFGETQIGKAPFIGVSNGNFQYGTGGGNSPTTTIQMPRDEFVLLTLTGSGSDIILYMNGEEIHSYEADFNRPVAANATVGDFLGLGLGIAWDGPIDDARIYAEGLEPWMVMDLFLDPEHHSCTWQTLDGTNNFVEAAAPQIITFVFFTGFIGLVMWQLARNSGPRKFGVATILLGAAVTLLGAVPEPAAAGHECIIGNAAITNLANMMWALSALSVVAGAASLGIMVARQKKKGKQGY